MNTKKELLEAICALSDAVPTMRVGQLMAAIGEVCNDLHGRGLWDAEDQELLEAVWNFQQSMEQNKTTELHPSAS
jgi:hypothetical protein